MRQTDISKGMMLALFGFFILVLSDSTAKNVSGTFSIWQIIFIFSATTIPFTLLIGWFRDRCACLKLTHLRTHLLRGVFVTLNIVLAFKGFSLLPMADAYALAFTSPMLTALIARVLLKEEIGALGIVSILSGFIGTLIVGFQPFDTVNVASDTEKTNYIIGVLCMIGAATSFSSSYVLVRSKAENITPISFHFYSFLFAVLPAMIILWIVDLTIPSFFDKAVLAPMSGTELLTMMLIGILGSTGTICLIQAHKFAPASLLGPFHYSQLLWGSIVGYLFFGNVLSQSTLVGAGFIVSSGLFVITNQYRKKRKARFA